MHFAPEYARALASTAIGGIACFLASSVVLHWLQPQLNPLQEAMSYYVHGKGGWLLTLGLLGLGIASLALTAALRSRTGGAGWWLLAIWATGAIIGAIFPADPPGQWDKPSLGGTIHGLAAMIALIVFPFAAVALSRRLRSELEWGNFSDGLRLLAWASCAGLVLFLCSLAPVFVRPGPPVLLGLTERILLGIYAVWLAVAAAGILRVETAPVKNGRPDSHLARVL